MKHSTNRFTIFINELYVILKSIETLGTSGAMEPLGERGVVVLRYIEKRIKRCV